MFRPWLASCRSQRMHPTHPGLAPQPTREHPRLSQLAILKGVSINFLGEEKVTQICGRFGLYGDPEYNHAIMKNGTLDKEVR